MLLARQRQQKILDLLQEEGGARVSSLSRIFGVSEPTIRQDLELLETDGLVTRTHGGAFLNSVPNQVRTMTLQRTENMEKKAVIGRRAAELINDGESIILDSGTTVTEVAKNLKSKTDLRIITDSINIALLLGQRSDLEIMLTGGLFKAPTLSVTGEKASSFFDHIHVDKLFLAAGGVSFDHGLTYPGFNDLPVKKAMIESATTTYVVADSSKIGRTDFAALGMLESVDCLITDSGISATDREELERRRVTVIVV